MEVEGIEAGKFYKHSNGTVYAVIGFGFIERDMSPSVTYYAYDPTEEVKPLEKHTLFTRELDLFTGYIREGLKIEKRFKECDEWGNLI